MSRQSWLLSEKKFRIEGDALLQTLTLLRAWQMEKRFGVQTPLQISGGTHRVVKPARPPSG
jgi:hypothetical protein